MLELLGHKRERSNLGDKIKVIVKHDRKMGTRGLEPKLSALIAGLSRPMPASEYGQVGHVRLGTGGHKRR